jgi:hypothetical protein
VQWLLRKFFGKKVFKGIDVRIQTVTKEMGPWPPFLQYFEGVGVREALCKSF